MPIEWKKARIPASGGIDTKTDPKQVSMEKNIDLENGEFGSVGQVEKRNGYDEIAITETLEGASIDDTCFMATREAIAGETGAISRQQGEILVLAKPASGPSDTQEAMDGWHMMTLNKGVSKYIDLGPFEPLELDVESVSIPQVPINSTVPERMPDIAFTNGYICLIWSDNAPDRLTAVTIIDTNTGALVVDRHRIDFAGTGYVARAPQVVAVGDSFHIYDIKENGGPYDLGLAVIDTNALDTLPSLYTIVRSDVDILMIKDTCYANHSVQGHTSVCAYRENTAGNVQIVQYREDGTFVNAVVDAVTVINSINIENVYDATNTVTRLCITRQDGATRDIIYRLFDEDVTPVSAHRTLVAYGAGENIRQITCIDADCWKNVNGWASSTLHWFLEYEINYTPAVWPLGTPWLHRIDQVYDSFAGGAIVGLGHIYNATLWSKAFSYDDRPHVWVVYSSPEQGTYFMISPRTNDVSDIMDARIDAKILYTRAPEFREYQGLGRCMPTTYGTWIWPLLRAERTIERELVGTYISRSVGYGVMKFPLRIGQMGLQHAKLGPTRTVAIGGQVADCDGGAHDLGFHLYPEPIGCEDVLAGSLPVDTYNYAVIYEFTDREGQVMRSAPGLQTYVLGTPNRRVRLHIPYLHKGSFSKLFGKGIVAGASDVTTYIKIYRQASDGVYHLIAEIANDEATGVPSTGITYYDDNIPDANILDNEVLYTEGGYLANIGAPSSQIIASDGKRMCLVPDDDQDSIWYSKLKSYGETINFSDLFTTRITSGGKLTGLASMDGKWILFQRAQISMFYGDGPNDLGHGQFSDIRIVTTDVGCQNRRSIGMTPRGLMFMSSKGLYLLDRSLQVSYLGAPAEYINDSITIFDTQVIENKNQIRWILSNGQTLVYDYLLNRWSIHHLRYLDGTCQNAGGQSLRDASLWSGRHMILRNNGYLYEENSASYEDETCGVPLDISTAWIKGSDLQGFQRIRRLAFLGDFHTECTLTVEVYYDYDETTVYQTVTFPITATILAENAPDQFRFRLERQKCQALKIRIYDSSWGTGNGRGYSFSGWELEIGMKRGIVKIKADRTL